MQSFRPAAAAPRAVVVIHHCLADHSDRYATFAERLAQDGYAVWALESSTREPRRSARAFTSDRHQQQR